MKVVRRSLGLLAAATVLATNAPAVHAAAPATAAIQKPDRTPGLDRAVKLRPTDPTRTLTVGVSLGLRNRAALNSFVAQVSDPKSPTYGDYLTPVQFAASYAPTQSQVQQVVEHLRTHGLTVTSVSSNRTLVDATGPAAAVEAAFGVSISDWHDRDQNRDFFGNDGNPTLPTSLASVVVGIAGLNNHYQWQRLAPSPHVPPGGGPAGGYTPTDLKTAYDVNPLASAGYNGTGQGLGLFELDGFQQANITTYDTHYGLASPAPTVVTIAGGPGTLGAGEIEVELDIEVMHALAPASPITVWEGPNSDPGANATYNAMVTSNTTKSNSTSWGICEPLTTATEMTTLDNIFVQGAAQGQSFYAASGDHGAYDCQPYGGGLAVDSPANDPYITGTGGSTLTLNSGSAYAAESAWSSNAYSPPLGSGGGLSTVFARPSWQTGPGVSNLSSNGMRQVPDVALDADLATGYSVYVTNGRTTGWNVVGGTSAAAPAWAAFTGLYNQYAAANGKPNLGFANPTLYTTASNSQPHPAFHDVTTGSNLYYSATTGWDYATGWGSYDAYNLARDLVGPAAVPGTPSAVFATEGDASATVSWTAPISNGGSAITGYRVTPYIGSTAQSATTFNSTATSQTISGLTNGTTYTFTVAAINTLGPGPDSAASNSVTPVASYVAGLIGTDSGLWTLHSGSPGFSSDGGVLLGAPAVVSIPQTAGPGLPIYLGTGSDHDLYVRSDTTGWQHLTTSAIYCKDNPAGIVNGGTLTLACTGSDNALYDAQTPVPSGTNLPSITASAWHSLGGASSYGPAVGLVGGVPTFGVVGTDQGVYFRTLTTPYVKQPGWTCTGHLALASFGANAYFACHGSADNALYYSTNTGGGWSPAVSLGGVLINGPGIAATSAGPTFFVEGSDGALYHRSLTTDFTRDGGKLQFGAAAAGL